MISAYFLGLFVYTLLSILALAGGDPINYACEDAILVSSFPFADTQTFDSSNIFGDDLVYACPRFDGAPLSRITGIWYRIDATEDKCYTLSASVRLPPQDDDWPPMVAIFETTGGHCDPLRCHQEGVGIFHVNEGSSYLVFVTLTFLWCPAEYTVTFEEVSFSNPECPFDAPTADPPTTDPPASEGSNPDSSGSCFSGHSVIQVQGKGGILMKDLKVGDVVLTADGSFSRVYTFAHFDPKQNLSFLQFQMGGMLMKSPLEISPEHLLYASDTQDIDGVTLIPAGDVKVGDHLLTDDGELAPVISIQSVTRQGVYAPYTVNGKVSVSGIVASNYIGLSSLQRVPWATHAWMQHVLNGPRRAYCHIFPQECEKEAYMTAGGYQTWIVPQLVLYQWITRVLKFLRVGFLQQGLLYCALVFLFIIDGAATVVCDPWLFGALLIALWRKQSGGCK